MPYTADQYANFASSTVAGGSLGRGTPLQATDTTLYLPVGDGAKFPQPANGATFRIQIGLNEIAICTGRATDTLTITRGAESSSATLAALGTTVQNVTSAASLSNLWTAINTGRMYCVTDNTYGAKGDGVTDDTSAVQAAITACQNAGGGVVYFPLGTYLISQTLNITVDNVQLLGAGWGAQLIPANAFIGAYLIYVQSLGSFRYGIRIQDLYLNCNGVGSIGGVNLESTYHAVLDHVRVRNIPGIGVYVNGLSNKFGAYNTLLNCTITDGVGASAYGVKTNNSEWLVIEGCSFVTFNTAGNYGVNLNNLNCIVNGSRFDNCDTALYLSFSSRNIVQGCQFDRAYTRFINLRGNQGTVIKGNVFNTNKGSGTECIYANDPNNFGNTICDNTVEPQSGWTYFVNESSSIGGPGNIIANNTLNGLQLNLKSGTAKGNIGFNPAIRVPAPTTPTATATGSGGTVPAGVYQVELTYVNAYGETTASSAASVTITSGQNLQITAPLQAGNAIGWYAYVTQAGGATFYRQQAAGSPSQFGNTLTITANPTTTGANPPGGNTTSIISQPAVPSSNTAYRNAFGMDCIVYVTGGTVSSIKVGDLTTGLTGGSFQVPAYSSITLNYTVAPTWEWVGS